MAPPPAGDRFAGRMPELRGLRLRSAMRALDGCDCEVKIDGHGFVVDQRPEPGVEVSAADEIRVVLGPRRREVKRVRSWDVCRSET